MSETMIPEPAPLTPSKSQRKRDARVLQALGEQLLQLSSTQLKPLPLPEALLLAVQEAQTITERGGRKRQLQYIGKLMRQLDASQTVTIRTALATLHLRRR